MLRRMVESGKARRWALISAYDKAGVAAFAAGLCELGFSVLSTGGTARVLREAGVEVRDVSEHTGAAEMLGGRVKTLHPAIHGGILARRDRPSDMAQLAERGIEPIDMVVCNLYPFEQARTGGEGDPAALRELIDIGGPCMVRAAAKSWPAVTVVCRPERYAEVLAELREHGDTQAPLRRALAAEAFERTAGYDRAIAEWLTEDSDSEGSAEPQVEMPESRQITLTRVSALRYGENPHQRAALYRSERGTAHDLGAWRVLSGKALSYNNLLDLDAAIAIARDLSGAGHAATASVVKHATPCGAGVGESGAVAFRAAHAGDPQSAFGGIVCCLPEVDQATAMALTEPGLFLECIASPGFTDAAREVLATRPKWRKSVRLVEIDAASPAGEDCLLRSVAGGVLISTSDDRDPFAEPFEVRSRRAPTPEEEAALRIALCCVKHARSNGIAIANAERLLGVGGGQPSRVGAVEIALHKAGDRVAGAALASDAFFPFADSIERAACAGITAIVEPGGSRRDAEVIAAADEHGLALVFTGVRHFKH
ncbi:MAG: bifunctional phosphoribosylaminoimidazolecarboxamide formyltransferase/IMP cyclohydrolase [Planctomycetota bacterium]|jgi:phosphoribosylaminoimidazolecarboxamide formyltransferase/IMP cyclohydrolase